MELGGQRHVSTVAVNDTTDAVTILNDLLTGIQDSLNGYRTVDDALEDGRYAALCNEEGQQREQRRT